MEYNGIISALKLMGQGMATIFFVMATIAFIIYLCIYFSNRKTKD